VQRIANLLVRLLAFSRNRPLAPRVIVLNDLAGEMGGMMRRLLGDDVTLDLELEAELWPTEIDPVEVEQVLVNLLVNAREAMPRGGRVTLGTANRRLGPHGAALVAGQPAAATEWVVLSVADRGEGIPDEVRERIFEPFFSTKGRSGHSGLGLATVYGVARRAGGFVRLESTPGEGACFEVHLPRATRAADAAEPEATAAPQAPAAAARLLLVEDNPVVADASAAFLSQVGHRVTRVRDGRAALARLEGGGGAFDAVVTDLVLPGASGREIAERALALDLPVVLVSAFPDRVEIADLLLEPRVRFLGKPFEPEALLAALADVLGTRPAVRRASVAAI
jgi:two-component system, cell cycle sensor histidine kinase and response regulator CckA